MQYISVELMTKKIFLISSQISYNNFIKLTFNVKKKTVYVIIMNVELRQ